MGICRPCRIDVPDADLLEHIRVIHPDVWAQVEKWPDGGPVIHDDDPNPDDVQEAPRA